MGEGVYRYQLAALNAFGLSGEFTQSLGLGWPGVARRQVTFFCFAKRKVTKEKATLPSPNSRSLNLPGGRRRNSARFLISNVSEPQTSTPLIRPADSDFGGAGRGKAKNRAWAIEWGGYNSTLCVINSTPMTSAAQFFEFVSCLVESDSAIICRWSEDRLKAIFPKMENSGFDIEVTYDPTSETLNLQTDHGYHDHFHINQFESFSVALSNVFGLVRDLLSPNMRIVETLANGKPRKWQLQALVNGNWATEANVGLLFWNVFGKKTTVEYINHVLPPREFNCGA